IRLRRMNPEQGAKLCLSALAHDLGKIELPLSILHDKGRLEGERLEMMRDHVIGGVSITQAGLDPSLRGGTPTIVTHHENLKGTGYPFGVTGEKLFAPDRVLEITDKFEAMTAKRVYGQAFTMHQTLDKLQAQADTGELDRELLETLKPVLIRFGREREM